MKRLIFIVEGDTEKAFVDKVLTPYLHSKEVYVIECFKIQHTNGGLIKYQHLKKDIINTIFQSNVLVTTLIDFYALPKDFPRYEEAKNILINTERISFLEQAIVEDIEKDKKGHFPNLIPYIQLHEFEALVFASIEGVTKLFDKSEVNFTQLNQIIENHPNPEDINDKPDTAPSKRLKSLIKGYSKVNDGIMIIQEIGIETILKKCPRFRNWVEQLIERSKG
jgi:hypothetical protein